MQMIRDRIVELRRVRAAELRRHPDNWRVHPDRQRSAMTRVLNEIGYADALVARVLADGSLQLIDGHLRADVTPEVEVPVLVVDLDDREAALLLAVHDAIGAMAETDEEILRRLLTRTDFERTSIDRVIRSVHGEQDDDLREALAPRSEPRFDDVYQVVIECDDERRQHEVFERLTTEGFRCRVLTL